MTKITSLSDLGILAAEMRASRIEQDVADEFACGGRANYDASFIETSEMAKLSIVAEPENADMPDAHQSAAAVELMMQTMFDVLRDTRMQECAGDLARDFDPSEIYAAELEQTQQLCQTLEGIRAALECMRDHAAEIYRLETGRPFSTIKGSRVSSKLTASVIDARDYLAGHAKTRREQYAPEGPVVAFSGGAEWHDEVLIWDRLDHIVKRIPNMILVTTARDKGCDATARAWAASRSVKVVEFKLETWKGSSAGFIRNDKIVALKPVEGIVCEGSGVQANLAQKLRSAGVPLHILRRADQRADDFTATNRNTR
ncbi:MAG: DUF2493 domain-containing protein [Porphyrobacter sp. IPPAS B-1204]|nr:MAG: DUF2493 domain-containing protein [Porphyrobacter sp. IPPAS B-1204]